MDNIKFSPENVRNYIMRTIKHNSNYNVIVPDKEFSTDAVMTLFDKNADGYITKKEFSGITKEQYNSYVTDLSKYNEQHWEDGRILNFESLADLVDKGAVSGEELNLNIHESYKLNVKNLQERKDYKDTSQMTEEELRQELISYGQDAEDETFQYSESGELRKLVKTARKEVAYYDNDSDNVDWHIGTYAQGKHGLCTFLALIENYTPEKLKSLYREKFDDAGKKYYEINFPIDSQAPKPIIITEEELKNGEITYKNPDSDIEQSVGIFSQGEADVKLLEMAFMKRFGDKYFKTGAAYPQMENIIKNSGKEDYIRKYGLTTEEFAALKSGATVNTMPYEVRKFLEIERKFTLPDGRTGEFWGGSIHLSDGTIVQGGHAIAVKKYDAENQELVIQGNEQNNVSELRVPLAMSRYFEASVPIELEQDSNE